MTAALEDATIVRVFEALVQSGLARSREALVKGLDPRAVAAIPKGPTEAQQLWEDLHHLNQEHLWIQRYLRNADMLLTPRTPEATKEALWQLERPPPSWPPEPRSHQVTFSPATVTHPLSAAHIVSRGTGQSREVVVERLKTLRERGERFTSEPMSARSANAVCGGLSAMGINATLLFASDETAASLDWRKTDGDRS